MVELTCCFCSQRCEWTHLFRACWLLHSVSPAESQRLSIQTRLDGQESAQCRTASAHQMIDGLSKNYKLEENTTASGKILDFSCVFVLSSSSCVCVSSDFVIGLFVVTDLIYSRGSTFK